MHLLFAPAGDMAALAASPLGTVAQLLGVVLQILALAIFIRAILTWFMPVGRDPATRLLVTVTEPILAPVRQLLRGVMPMQGMDLSPLVVLLLIQFVLVPLVGSIR